MSSPTYQYDTRNRLTQLGVPAQGSCPALPTGLVSRWLAEGTALDSVGSNHGTLLNGATFTTGQFGQAFQFDGVDDLVHIPDAPALKPATLTLAAWVRFDNLDTAATLPGLQYLVFKKNTRVDFFEGYTVAKVRGLDGADRFALIVSNASGVQIGAASTTTIQTGRWYQVAGSFDGVRMRLYVNGAQEAERTVPTGFALDYGTRPLWFGTSGEPHFDGKLAGRLDDIQLYNIAVPSDGFAGVLCQQRTLFAYDALSRRTAMTLPNGTSTTYTYDPASQVTNILHQLTATSTTINQAGYLYNAVGNRTSLTDRRGAQSFGYDNLDRLTSASHPFLATPQAFAYDPVGNRTTGGSVVNAGNQLTADANHAYQYDDNGNLTRKTLLATGNFTQYTYDAENRLIKAEDFLAGNPTLTATSTYRYDGLGRRIEKVTPSGTRLSRPPVR